MPVLALQCRVNVGWGINQLDAVALQRLVFAAGMVPFVCLQLWLCTTAAASTDGTLQCLQFNVDHGP
jgi:hypothetical protein